MNNNFNTPMMLQYEKLKEKYQDCLLFFRLGDFYELFLDDAKIGANVLDITLTSRDRGKDGRIPMAGVPYHALDSYVAKLVKSGYKVAICEQLSDSSSSGIVERDVVRIITPGTILDEKSLEKKENNYIVSLLVKGKKYAFAACDLSTSDFQVLENEFVDDLANSLLNVLSTFNASECVLPESLYNDPSLLRILKSFDNLNIYSFWGYDTYANNSSKYLKNHFKVSNLDLFGFLENSLSARVASGLLGYLKHTQKDKIVHINKIKLVSSSSHLVLDKSTIHNLEIFQTIREKAKKGSLVDTLDKTKTAMGGRLLRRWVIKPLTDISEINYRLDIVEYFIKNKHLSKLIEDTLVEINDMERLVAKLSAEVGSPKDLIALKTSIYSVLNLKKILEKENSSLFSKILFLLDETKLEDIYKLIDSTILDDPSFDPKSGGIVKDNTNSTLDELKRSIKDSKLWLLELENIEKEKTGINSLKVSYNKVYGFYIEISKNSATKVPPHYIRKQTMVNTERFITPELKEKEEVVTLAEEKINNLEFEIFKDVVARILQNLPVLQNASLAVSETDCYLSFAQISVENSYTRPKIINSNETYLYIKDGRHPVVEKFLEDTQFVPNDIKLESNNSELIILTGPNMAGKSVYIRQVAIISLMAHVGVFVPAAECEISILDRIFVRSGASDSITHGMSTFMVEMTEASNILHNATSKSLIIMDEIGRGTSTYDGISIAWAIAEYIVIDLKAKGLFATHYHELQNLADHFPNKIKNFHASVDDSRGTPIFLHKINEGPSNNSYGIAVAKLSGMPDKVTSHAFEILSKSNYKSDDLDIFLETPLSLRNEIKKIDLNSITPIEALKILEKLKKTVEIVDE